MMNKETTDSSNETHGSGCCCTPRPTLYNVANLVGFIANVVITFGFGLWGWADRPTNGDLSAKYQTIVTPSGTAFSIWSLIFIAQAMWVVMQWVVPSQRQASGIQAVGLMYFFACLAQCGWTLAFTWEIIWLSLVFMYAILGFLGWSVYKLETRGEDQTKNWKSYFIHQFPLAIHCGWIMAASVVNTNVVLVAYGASVSAQLGMASFTLAVLLLAGFAVLLKSNELTIPCVLAWALGWVYNELANKPLPSITERFTATQIQGIQYTAIAGTGVLLVLVLARGVMTCLSRDNTGEQESSSTPQGDEEAPEQ